MKNKYIYIASLGALFLSLIRRKMTKYPLLWNTILKGESKTFNDYNFYKVDSVGANKLYGRINPKDTLPFSSKLLTQLTIKEVLTFQSQTRAKGQLWATGRFQIIPTTLKTMVTRLKIPTSSLYSESIQYKIADGLIDGRRGLNNYLNGKVEDNQINLTIATLDVAKEWSSVGVPYAMQGHRKYVQKDESYYSGGGDKASVSSASVMDVLKRQRKALGH